RREVARDPVELRAEETERAPVDRRCVREESREQGGGDARTTEDVEEHARGVAGVVHQRRVSGKRNVRPGATENGRALEDGRVDDRGLCGGSELPGRLRIHRARTALGPGDVPRPG